MSWRAPKFWDDPYLSAPAVLLMPLAWLYGTITHLRLKTASPKRALAPTVCIGSPTLGGAGKTPVAIAIAKILARAGRKPGFLSRGYGGKASRPILVTPQSSTESCGDEPLLLARHFPTVVSTNRPWGAETLLNLDQAPGDDLGAPLSTPAASAHKPSTDESRAVSINTIVMDDGFHNPSLEKDLSFLVIDKTAGLGNGLVFPAGPLRMPMPQTLRRADALIVAGAKKADLNPDVSSLMERCGRRGLPVLTATVEPDGTTLKQLRESAVVAYAGIGRPEKFFESLQAGKIDLVSTFPFPDHHSFTADDAERLLQAAADAKATLVTTEKDQARLMGARVGPLARLHTQSTALPISVRFSRADQMVIRELFDGLADRSKGKRRER
jgi:tetraacyldisaccharide 4'-kinase